MRDVNYKVITSAGSCVVKTYARANEICSMYPGSRYEVVLTDTKVEKSVSDKFTSIIKAKIAKIRE